MSFLEPRVNFSSNFASLFSDMRYNSSVNFYLNLFMLCMPYLIKVQFFRLSTACMKINQIPYVIFQARSQFSFKFCKTPEIFCVKHYMLWTERANQHIVFHLMRVHPIARAIFETTKDLFNFCITVQCHERSLLYIFLAQTSYTLDKNSPLK